MEKKIRDKLIEAGVWADNGHFLYSSGYHGNTYFDKDALYAQPQLSSLVGQGLAEMVGAWAPDAVLSPAPSGIALTQWAGFHLMKLLERPVLALYVEKNGGPDKFQLGRGLASFVAGRKIAIIDDNINDGLSIRHMIDVVNHHNGKVLGVATVMNRGRASIEKIGNPPHLVTLLQKNIERWSPEECPICPAALTTAPPRMTVS